MKDKFNKYCAEVMGYKEFDLDLLYDRNYNPYEDLNHMADVVEKLLDNPNMYYAGDKFPNKYMINRDGFKQSFRNFIISIMSIEEEDESI